MFELTNDLLVIALLFIIIFSITFYIFQRIFQSKGIAAVIGLAVSILSIFYLSDSQILLVIQTYGIMGSALLISIPFIIAFFFMYTSEITGVLRKMFFVFYGIISIMLLQKSNSISSEAITYLTFVIILITIIIFFLDNGIKTRFNIHKNLKTH